MSDGDTPNSGYMDFVNEETSSTEARQKKPPKPSEAVWRILITDDEPDVHSATSFALRNTKILNRRLEFLHASSAQEAADILRNESDIAVIILDVVMETPNAGLDLVPVIRKDLGITDSRIILRTGQPNQAPEIEIIRDYDVNDYKLKSELTQNKLYASLTTAIRSYKQIQMIEAGKKGLDMIVRSCGELLTKKGLNEFAQGVITHLCGLLSIPPEGLICVRRAGQNHEDGASIIAAAGHYCFLIGHPLEDLVEEEAKDILLQSLDDRRNIYNKYGLAIYLGSDARGDVSCYVSSHTELSDVDQNLLELFCSNITVCADNLSLLDRLSRSAYFDLTVKLPNRNALVEIIDKLPPDKMKDMHLALVDIDSFSDINTSFGQDYGDDLLVAIGERLSGHFMSPVTVARVYGDIFAILGSSNLVTPESIKSVFSTPFKILFQEQHIFATGCVVALIGQVSGTELLKHVNTLLKSAKQNARGEILAFNVEDVRDSADRLALLNNLRQAFEQGNLYLAYQPIFDMKTRLVKGFEAYIRWRKDDGTFILPEQFIPLAEQSGLIIQLGEWLLSSALKTLGELRDQGWNQHRMSVNISISQLHKSDIVTLLKEKIVELKLDPQYIDLEITESVVFGDRSSIQKTLEQLVALGVTLSIDDFGTGYSSLNYLHKMPFSRLKVDETIVRQIVNDDGHVFAKLIADFARSLNLTITGEGVETEQELKALSDIDCHEIQGFLLSIPLTQEELYSWLKSQ